MSKLPPSLKNIYWELRRDLVNIPKTGSLVGSARQGVFLLNRTLTVQESSSNSHSDFGWHYLAEETLKHISDEVDHFVFMLWGDEAQKASKTIDCSKHMIITSSHPSPHSVGTGLQPFCGSRPFSRANNWLKCKGRKTINRDKSK